MLTGLADGLARKEPRYAFTAIRPYVKIAEHSGRNWVPRVPPSSDAVLHFSGCISRRLTVCTKQFPAGAGKSLAKATQTRKLLVFAAAMVLVFGATGFSGSLLVERLLALGVPVRIAARSQQKLEAMSAQYGGLEWIVVDADDPSSLDRACSGATVLVTTVGPYSHSGHVAIEAAIRHRLAYIDITGEPAFIRRVFEQWGPQAVAAGVPLLTAFGHDYVPGNLAAATALEHAGAAAVTVDVGYFLAGQPRRNAENFSVGTLESLKASGTATRFAFRDGQLREQPPSKQVIDFTVAGPQRTAVAIGSTEHLALPRSFPQLQNVNVALGWFDNRASGSAPAPTDDASSRTSLGPSTETQAKLTSNIIAIARDMHGAELATAMFDGPNPYPLTAGLVAWAAQQIISGQVSGVGALGPIEAFGLPTLTAACAAVGLKRV